MLTDRKMELEKLAKALLDREVLFQSDVELLIGKRPYGEKKPVHIIDPIPEEHHAKSAEEIAALPAELIGHTASNGQEIEPETSPEPNTEAESVADVTN
jgi:hypothetical protein